MSAENRIAVVIPMYNGNPFIADTLTPLSTQKHTRWTCTVVDDGSTDASPETVAEIAEHDARITLVRSPNRGVAHARNLGAARAPDSDYLLFLDADDLLEPTALSTLAAYLDRNEGVGTACCQFRRIDETGAPITLDTQVNHRTRWCPGCFGIPRDLPPTVKNTPFVVFLCGSGQGPNALIRRSTFAAINGYDETLVFGDEDTDLFCRLALAQEVHYLPDVLYLYRHRNGSLTANSARMNRGHKAFMEKWTHYRSGDPATQRTINQALDYYYRTFVHLRQIRIAYKAARELFAQPRWGHAHWMLKKPARRHHSIHFAVARWCPRAPQVSRSRSGQTQRSGQDQHEG